MHRALSISALVLTAATQRADAQELYTDPAGRFAIQLPPGWTQRVPPDAKMARWGNTEGKLFGQTKDGFCWVWVQTEPSAEQAIRFARATKDLASARQYVQDAKLVGPGMKIDSIKVERVSGVEALYFRYSNSELDRSARDLSWVSLLSIQPQRADLVWCTLPTGGIERTEPIVDAMFRSYKMIN